MSLMSFLCCLPKKEEKRFRIISDSGQALLVILLSMTVILTVVLSVVSRTVTDITITTYQEDAQRAFDAAEAGIEDALLTGTATGGDVPIGNATYNVSFVYPVPDKDQYVYPDELRSGESATFWFAGHDTDGNLSCGAGCIRSNRIDNLCWGVPGSPDSQPGTPAVELIIYYDTSLAWKSTGNFSGMSVARAAFDPNTGRTATNNFYGAPLTNCQIGGENFAFGVKDIRLDDDSLPNFNLSCPSGMNSEGCLILAKVRMFYNDIPNPPVPHRVGIDIRSQGMTDLPPQGTEIDSIGAAGDTTRRINVFQSYPELPFVFDSAIFGQGDLTK